MGYEDVRKNEKAIEIPLTVPLQARSYVGERRVLKIIYQKEDFEEVASMLRALADAVEAEEDGTT